ncbi:hypothetical protein BLAT2472_130111 [Burkholderia latens]|uniref:hypothetical protein n=1 Tax=Burkholderia latens TaxID=488446 RepID=UPI0039A4904C
MAALRERGAVLCAGAAPLDHERRRRAAFALVAAECALAPPLAAMRHDAAARSALPSPRLTTPQLPS